MRDRLSMKTVRELRTLIVTEASTVSPDDTVEGLLEKLIRDPRTRKVYAVDSENVLKGEVRLNAVVSYLFPHEAAWHSGAPHIYSDQMLIEKVSDIMDENPRFVKDTTTVSEMAQIMIEEKTNELPVVDENNKVIGEVNMLEAVAYYVASLKQ